MNEWIDWFQRVLDVSIRLYFRQECDLSSVYDIPLPKAGPLWKALLPEQVDPTFDEICQQPCSIYRVTLCCFQNEVQNDSP